MDALFCCGFGLVMFGLGALSQYLAVRIAIRKDWDEYNRKLNVERDNVNGLEQEKRWLAEELVK